MFGFNCSSKEQKHSEKIFSYNRAPVSYRINCSEVHTSTPYNMIRSGAIQMNVMLSGFQDFRDLGFLYQSFCFDSSVAAKNKTFRGKYLLILGPL